jgi:hypothetical protein
MPLSSHARLLACQPHHIPPAGLCHDLGHGPLSHSFQSELVPKLLLPGEQWSALHRTACLPALLPWPRLPACPPACLPA